MPSTHFSLLGAQYAPICADVSGYVEFDEQGALEVKEAMIANELIAQKYSDGTVWVGRMLASIQIWREANQG